MLFRSLMIVGTLTLNLDTVKAASKNNLTDSNITEASLLSNTGDERGDAKISLPDFRTYRKADREMNRNMANHIKELKNLRLEAFVSDFADEDITDGFYSQFRLVNFYKNSIEMDDKLSEIFSAENINNNYSKYSQISDNEINKIFTKQQK